LQADQITMKRPPPVLPKSRSLFHWLGYRTKLWFYQAALAIFIPLMARRTRKLPPNQRPTLTRCYPPLPNREVRIFIPITYKAGDAPLPLLIDIHGGGFCLGAPVVDDRDNCALAYEHGFCVASIPYRLGPEVKHPGGARDAAAMIAAVLDDESLPVDRTRVAVAGYSAGGTLALAATQLPGVKGRVAASVAYYPATDNSRTLAERAARQKLPPGGVDYLHGMVGMFDVGYIAAGTDRTDPVLSPIFADRADLPEKMYILGCEFDMLCPEAEDMAEDLAQHEAGERVALGGGRVGWRKGNLQWELIEGVIHGFNQVPASGTEGEMRRAKTKAMHVGVAEWLKREVYQV
jgi:acetyl esterase/lipase